MATSRNPMVSASRNAKNNRQTQSECLHTSEMKAGRTYYNVVDTIAEHEALLPEDDRLKMACRNYSIAAENCRLKCANSIEHLLRNEQNVAGNPLPLPQRSPPALPPLPLGGAGSHEKEKNANAANGNCARHDQLASLGERMNHLEIGIRMRLADLDNRIKLQLTSIEERIIFLEKFDDKSMSNGKPDALIAPQTTHGEEASMEIRLECLDECLEALIAQTSSKHAKEVEKNLEIWTKLGNNSNQLAGFDERMNSLEKAVGLNRESIAEVERTEIDSSVIEEVDSGDNGKALDKNAKQSEIKQTQDSENAPAESALTGRDAERRLNLEECRPSQTSMFQGSQGGLAASGLRGCFMMGSLIMGLHRGYASRQLCHHRSASLHRFIGCMKTAVQPWGPKSSNAALIDHQTALPEGAPVTPPKGESQSESSVVMQAESSSFDGTNTLEWLHAHRMDSNTHIVGSWSYKGDTFHIHEAAGYFLFTQHGFTGRLEAIDDWLQVHIPEANGMLRLQIDCTGNRLRAQFKRSNQSRWRKTVLVEKTKAPV